MPPSPKRLGLMENQMENVNLSYIGLYRDYVILLNYSFMGYTYYVLHR